MKLASSILMASLAITCWADPIDDFVRAELARTKSPSIAIGIIKDGKLVKHEIYGKANLELDVDAKKGDLYEIGSITKQFTAMATMLLVEDGKLTLDDPISKHLPEAPEAWKKIKIRNLLYQTSGLPDYAFEQGIGLVDRYEREKWMGIMTKLPLDFEPGVAWAYSNTNFALLGWIIEKASGTEYTTFMRDRIFKPLGMTSTTFSNPDEIILHRATGYMSYQGQVLRSQYSSASINSDGTILSNIEDMAKWDTALRERKLLQPSSYSVYLRAAELDSGRWRPYGMGINLSLPGTEPYYGHGGNSAGYSAGYACYPNAGISVIVMGNIYAFGGEPMAKQIAELYEPKLKPAIPATKPDPNTKRTESIKQALAALGNGSSDSPLLEAEITAPMKTRRAGLSQGMVPLKNVEKLEFSEEITVGKDRLLTYKIVTKTRDFVGTLLWSSNDKLAMLTMRPIGPPKPQG